MADLEQQVTRGRTAAAFLEDPVFRDAVEAVRKRTVEQWQSTQPTDVQAREGCHALMRALDSVLGEINKVVNDGKVAQNALARQKQRAN